MSDSSGLRVLIVEDEGLIVEELRERLGRAGLDVVSTADSAEGALTNAIHHRPDLVLMDIRIKGARDGVEAARDIGQQLRVPVVFLTAHSDRQTLDRAKSVAPFGYVLKPFQERELLVAIEIAMHRHRLEQQLKESEQRYAATLASIGDGVIAADLQGHVTYMNHVAEALTGWSLSDARGLPAERIFQVARDVHGAHPRNPIGAARRTSGTVGSTTAELFLRSRTNETIPIDNSAAPIVDDRGGVVGSVVAFRDIRGRRLAADAVQRAQEELAQSQKMESVGRLAAGVAHDFNNLLTVVNGCAGLALDDGNLTLPIRDLLAQILGASERAAALTRQLLAFGGKQTLRPTALNLCAVVTDVASMLSRLIGDNIELRIEVHPTALNVFADASQLEQIIVNLAVNARDAMPGGGSLTLATATATIPPSETMAVETALPPGRYALLTVADTGSGIDPAIRDTLFEPYFTTKGAGKGSGLGLATAYGIVKQSGGLLEVDSVPGRGTTFTVWLPLTDTSTGFQAKRPGRTAVKRGGETVLVVDDVPGVRTLVAKILRQQGYVVIEARDAAQALRHFDQDGPIDLVVTDVVMPGMTGPALVEHLRARNKEQRVVYMSGHPGDSGSLTDGEAFIQKPFVLSELTRTVREVLDR